jgi:hypothetical protein
MAMPTRFSPPRFFLLWINVLSLDAPVVAVVWQDFFARCLHVPLAPAWRWLLAITAWLAYVADRWLDAWKLGGAVTPRRRFAQRHRAKIASVWMAMLLIGLWLAWTKLPSYLFQRGWMIAAVVAIYFFINQWRGLSHGLRGFKEISIAVLFGCATLIFVLPPDASLTLPIVWSAVVWCLVCFLDCYAIAGWELETDRAEKQESIVTRWPKLRERVKAAAAIVFFLALAPLPLSAFSGLRPIGLAVAGSALGLGLLDVFVDVEKLQPLRATPDLMLLTPLLWRIFW